VGPTDVVLLGMVYAAAWTVTRLLQRGLLLIHQ
jgi:hypothetical protein